MSLLRDIQSAAIAQQTDVPTLLRMCKLLAARLGNEPFAQWVDWELDGYPSIDSLPDYRIISVSSYGTYIGSYRQAQRLAIPLSTLPERLQYHYRNAFMALPVSAYRSLANDDGGIACEDWPMEIALNYGGKAIVDMQCIAAWKEIPQAAFSSMMDSVKTRILGFVIDIEREAPDAGESPLNIFPVSQEKVTQIFNTNISGNVRNLANASSSFSQVAHISIAPGDWSAVQTYLQQLGLSEDDVTPLRTELEACQSLPPKKALNGPAASWIGKLAAKAAQGATGVSLEVAAAGIAKAIAAYLGLG